MRSCLVAHCPPDPPWSGERRRVAAAWRFLSDRGDCDLVLCSLYSSVRRRLARKLRRPLAPPYAARARPPSNVDWDAYDLIWIFELWAMTCVPINALDRAVWDKDTLLGASYARAGNPLTRLLGRWTTRYELGMLKRVPLAVLSNPDDVRRLDLAGVHHLPHQLPKAAPGHHPRKPGPPRLGFIGLLSYEPNRLALLDFARNVLPSLREPRGDGVELLVGGAGLPADDAGSLPSQSGVRLLGYVDDLAGFYAAIDVAIAPMTEGQGTPTKVAEALVHGVPVVATTAGLRGLDIGLRRWCVEVERSWPEAIRSAVRISGDGQGEAMANAAEQRLGRAAFEARLELLLGKARLGS